MDTRTLVSKDEIELGRNALQVLSGDEKLGILVAMWRYNENLQQLRFTLSSRLYEEKGSHTTYLRIRKALSENGLLEQLPLDRISLISDREPCLTAIRKLYGGSFDTELYNIMIDGVEIPDCYIYRLPKRSIGGRSPKRMAN